MKIFQVFYYKAMGGSPAELDKNVISRIPFRKKSYQPVASTMVIPELLNLKR